MVEALSKRARIGLALVVIILLLPDVVRIVTTGDLQVTRPRGYDVYVLGGFIALVGYVLFELLMAALLWLDDEYEG